MTDEVPELDHFGFRIPYGIPDFGFRRTSTRSLCGCLLALVDAEGGKRMGLDGFSAGSTSSLVPSSSDGFRDRLP